MVTVLVVCERPARPSAEKAASCIQAEAGKLLAFDGIASVTVTGLRMTDPTLPQVWDWLVEIELGDESDAAELVDHVAFADFMGELRSLRTHPIAVLADATTAISFSRASVP